MLAAGAAAYPILWFVIAATIARGIRYYGLAGLVWLVGDKAEHMWREHRTTAAVIATVAVVAIVAVMLLI